MDCGVYYRDIFVLAVALFGFFAYPLSPSSMQIILPDLLTKNNDSTVNKLFTTPVQIGIFHGLQKLPALLIGVQIGWIVSICDSRRTFCFAYFLQAISNVIIAINGRFSVLCLAAILKGTGMIIGIVSAYDVIAKLLRDDRIRARVNTLGSIATALGYAAGYFMGPVVYTLYGRTVLFLIIGSLELVLAIAIIPLMCVKQEEDGVTSDADGHEKLTGDDDEVGDDSYLAMLRTPAMLALLLQTFIVYYTMTNIVTVGFFWLQTNVGITVEQNGLILAISSVASTCLLILVGLMMTNNSCRCWLMLAFILLQAAGFMAYPYIVNVLSALLAQTAIGLSKAVVTAVGPSIQMYIVDTKRVGTHARAVAVFLVVKTSAGILSNVISGYVLDLIGFWTQYVILAVVLVPAAFLSLCFDLDGYCWRVKSAPT